MKALVALLLLSSSVTLASVIPVDNPERLVQDELFPYQWGLLNEGQTLIREKDDIHNLPLKGISGKDIGWRALQVKEQGKRPVIAVLDSGVDLSHPELQGNLWKNEDECGKDPSQDHDGNGLKGDCHGWNFTQAIDSDLAKDPGDSDGHGTHIAGIIAALNNGSGIVGVVPNALIMPVKVMRDSNSESNVPSSEAFARGIRYAVIKGADVINMSLGWPKSLETKALKDAVYFALGRGVPIVAAAGNNNSSEPLYPCAYDGVICVGATTVNGSFASFSNFGGHVDTLAPGEGILGLHPVLLEPDFFPVPGFELRSGTSQSAPFVAGMIAALKVQNKDLTIDQIFAKLYQARALRDDKKYIQGGMATWELLKTPVEIPVLRPVFKNLRYVTFEGESSVTKIPLTIRNFGLPATNIKVKVESLSKGISVDTEVQEIPSLGEGEYKKLEFEAQITDFSVESNLELRVTIESNGEKSHYSNEVPVIRDIFKGQSFKKSTFIFTDKPLPMGGKRENTLVPLISTLDSYGRATRHEFFMKKTLKDEKKVELTLFTKKGVNYVQHKRLIELESALGIINFLRADVNQDGREDYVIQYITESDDKKHITFAFYNEDLKPLWSNFNHVKMILDLDVEKFNRILFMKYTHSTLGKMLVPAFFTKGMLPKVDQSQSSWDRLDLTKKNRLYFLEPSGSEFRIRTVTTNGWEENLKKELKSKWFETVETEQVLPISSSDVEKGQLRVLVSVGQGTRRKLSIHTFDAHSTSKGSHLPQLVLQTENIDPILKVTSRGLEQDGEVYFNIYDRTRGKLVSTRGESQIGEYVLKHETETDLIAGHIASFENSSERFSVFQTREELISITNSDSTKRSSRAKLRYSFLSQKLLSEMYFPVSYMREGKHRPALFVDGTSITGNRVYLFEEQSGELISSIRNSILVPGNCRSLNPAFNELSGTYEFVFLCVERGGEFVIRTYEMK